jgi:dolichol kinase
MVARAPRRRPLSKGDAKELKKHNARQAKWAANRWSVPYPTDGPKVTFGVLWFAALLGAALLGFNYDNAAVSSVAVAVVTSTVAALAGLQIGFAWFPRNSTTRSWTAGAAFTAGIGGFYGPWGVVFGLILALVILSVYLILYRGHRRPPVELFDVLARAAIPVGLASASLAAMAFRNLPVLIALVLLVSAYEVGDFLVGSGAFNPVEGPMAGLIAAAVVAFFLFLIEPDPFSSETIIVFVAIAAVCCPAGQYLASALLPRGNTWAPALRRLDSYLLVAPLWLLLLVLLPDLH